MPKLPSHEEAGTPRPIGSLPVNPNFLVIDPDDLGKEYLKAYAQLPEALWVHCPTINRLVQQGVKFTRAYSIGLCSPTRATWMTGRFPFKSGIGALAEGTNQPLLTSNLCLPAALKIATDELYTCGAFGKWHLSSFANRGGEYEHPVRVGFDWFEGRERPLGRARFPRGGSIGILRECKSK